MEHVVQTYTGFSTAGGRKLDINNDRIELANRILGYQDSQYLNNNSVPKFKTLKEYMEHIINVLPQTVHTSITDLFIQSLPYSLMKCLDYRLDIDFGHKEAHQALSRMFPKILTEWTRIHYSQIVYKLSSYCRLLYVNKMDIGTISMLSPSNMLRILSDRYQREMRNSSRPSLRRVVEGDVSSQYWLTLFVVDINSSDIIVSDGWYSIKMSLYPDSASILSHLVKRGSIFVGQKIHVCGARLISNANGKNILTVDPTVSTQQDTYLLASMNMIKRARWHERLGIRYSRHFKSSLSSIMVLGGQVPFINVVVCSSGTEHYHVKREYNKDIDSNSRISMNTREFELFVGLVEDSGLDSKAEFCKWFSNSIFKSISILVLDNSIKSKKWAILRLKNPGELTDHIKIGQVIGVSNTVPLKLNRQDESLIHLDSTTETILTTSQNIVSVEDQFCLNYMIDNPKSLLWNVAGILIKTVSFEKPYHQSYQHLNYHNISSTTFLCERTFLGSPIYPNSLAIVESRARQFRVQGKSRNLWRSTWKHTSDIQAVFCRGLSKIGIDRVHNFGVFRVLGCSTIQVLSLKSRSANISVSTAMRVLQQHVTKNMIEDWILRVQECT